MKISQAKNYKKPLYAIGLSAAIMAVAVTGCTDPGSDSRGGRTKGDGEHKPAQTEVQLAGETTVESLCYAGDIQIDGEAYLGPKVEYGD